MRLDEVNQLAPGVYQLHWRRGGWSLAAVGILRDGRRWYSPCNWTAASQSDVTSSNWRMVERVNKLTCMKAGA